MLSIAAIAALAAYSNQSSTDNHAPGKVLDPEIAAAEVSIGKRNGFSAAKMYNQMDRQHRQGSHIMEGQGITTAQSFPLEDPNFDPVAFMAWENARDSEVDRLDTEWAYRTQQAKVVSRRNNPVVAALSEEIHHPDDSSARSTFVINQFLPNYHNEANRTEAMREMREYGESDRDRQLRSESRPLFLGNAPGQSFRYSEF